MKKSVLSSMDVQTSAKLKIASFAELILINQSALINKSWSFLFQPNKGLGFTEQVSLSRFTLHYKSWMMWIPKICLVSMSLRFKSSLSIGIMKLVKLKWWFFAKKPSNNSTTHSNSLHQHLSMRNSTRLRLLFMKARSISENIMVAKNLRLIMKKSKCLKNWSLSALV